MLRRGGLLGVAVVVVGLLGVGSAIELDHHSRPIPSEGGKGFEVVAAPPETTPTTAPSPPPSWIATLVEPVSWSATPGGATEGQLPLDNPFGGRTVLAVVGTPGAAAASSATPGNSGWIQVELPIRPNGSVGWIPSSAVTLATTQYALHVDLAARTLTVTKAGVPVLTTPAAVGSPTSPTPPDNTYLWELVRPDDPNGAYGPYIFGLGEFSDTYTDFNGGEAQIGIHGQDEPWSIGKAVSNGCVRLPNDVITRLAGMLPLGTPVTIS